MTEIEKCGSIPLAILTLILLSSFFSYIGAQFVVDTCLSYDFRNKDYSDEAAFQLQKICVYHVDGELIAIESSL
jgi:hypothetical protein